MSHKMSVTFIEITPKFELVKKIVKLRRGASAFNWWEENCCIFFKKISSPNVFYVFLPLFKHQTTPYNVLFFQKMKKYAFLFSFQTGTGSQWEGPHNNNKATCP